MSNEYILTMLVIISFSYFLGSIPTAYLVAKSHHVDIFNVGSGNMGGTNVARTLGLRWGVFVGLVDTVKGIVAIYVAQAIAPASKAGAISVAATVVVLGHNWSLLASILSGTIRKGKIPGGKGAATAFGTLLMFAPIHVIIIMAAVCGVIILLTRYVSLGVLISFSLGIIWLTVLILQSKLEPDMMFYLWTLALMMAIRFRSNIQRLIAGTERRFGERV